MDRNFPSQRKYSGGGEPVGHWTGFNSRNCVALMAKDTLTLEVRWHQASYLLYHEQRRRYLQVDGTLSGVAIYVGSFKGVEECQSPAW